MDAGIADHEAHVGELFTLAVPDAAFADDDDDDDGVSTLMLSAVERGGDGLPSWLFFDAASRTFIGTPRSEGKTEVMVTATDPHGATAQTTFVIRVVDVVMERMRLALAIGAPAMSVLSVALGAYLSKGKLRTWLGRYAKHTASITVGDDFVHTITALRYEEIGKIVVLTKTVPDPSCCSCCGRCGWCGCGGDEWMVMTGLLQAAPEWLTYRRHDNAIAVVKELMEARDAGVYRVQVVGQDKGIREELTLTVVGKQGRGRGQGHWVAKAKVTGGSSRAHVLATPPPAQKTTLGRAAGGNKADSDDDDDDDDGTDVELCTMTTVVV